jgi:putative peptidoglycan lipid II flippase
MAPGGDGLPAGEPRPGSEPRPGVSPRPDRAGWFDGESGPPKERGASNGVDRLQTRGRRMSPRSRGYSPREDRIGTGSGAAFAVAGDILLSAETAAPDLSDSSAARLQGRAIALAGVVVVVGVVLSRVLGFVRTGVLNAEFGGNSPELAAFTYAFRVPDTLFQLVAAGAVGSAVVPIASELLAMGENERARRLIGTITNLMILALLPMVILAWIGAPLLVATIVAPGSPPAQQQLTADLTRWLLLSPVLLGVGAVITAGLNSLGIFGPPAMAPNVYNLGIILAALILTPFMGVGALVLGVILGAAGHVATQLPSAWRHKLYRPVLDLHDPAVRQTLKLIAPRAFGLGVTQIVFFVYVALLSFLPNKEGPVNWWNTAFVTLQIPVGLIGVPLGIVLLPPLARSIAGGDNARFSRLVDGSLRLLLWIVIPLMGFMAVLATPAMTLLWRHGNWTATDVSSSTAVFLVLLVGLVAHVLIALLAPIFYAGKDTRTPVMAALLAVAVDVVGALVLFPFFGAQGLALAMGLGAWVEVAMLLYLMERRIGFDLAPIFRTAAAVIPGAALASGAAFAADRIVASLTKDSVTIPALIAELGVAGLAGAVAYAGWSRALRLQELDGALDLARTVLSRRKA